MNLIDAIQVLLDEGLTASRNHSKVWLYCDDGEAYVGKSRRFLSGGSEPQWVVVNEIANISVELNDRGRGTFTRILQVLKKRREPIYVESVINSRLRAFLLKNGFSVVPHSEPPSLVWTPEEVPPHQDGCALRPDRAEGALGSLQPVGLRGV